MLSGHSAAQEIKHLWKFTSGFIEPQILNFEGSLSLSPALKAVLFRLAKFLLEALVMLIMICNLTVTLIWTVVLLRSWYQMGVQFNKEWTKIPMAISQCGTPRVFNVSFFKLFCGHSSSSQEFVTVGINLGTVWSLFYYWTSKLINLLLFPSFPNSHHLHANFPSDFCQIFSIESI